MEPGRTDFQTDFAWLKFKLFYPIMIVLLKDELKAMIGKHTNIGRPSLQKVYTNNPVSTTSNCFPLLPQCFSIVGVDPHIDHAV